MDHNSCIAHEVYKFPDLNNVGEDEELMCESDIIAENDIEYLKVNLVELENRLAEGEIMEDEHTAYTLYCEYGRAKGFSVRKGKHLWNYKHDFIIGKLYLCSREGFKDKKRSTKQIPEYEKTTDRCGCDARLRISRSKGEQWKVAVFKKEHNHELYAVDESYLLRKSRNITDEQRILLNTMVQSGLSVTKSFDFMKNLAQGEQNLGFTRREAFDSVYRERRKKKIDSGDAIGLVQHFKSKSNRETNFYWNIEVENDITLMNVFFRDSQCLAAYESFGDILTFDTTYRTNKYGLICAPFVGINHHKDNVFFGFALLSDETQNSFEWLFHTFLESMGGKQPQCIFTDQCQAMMNALDIVFPSAHHRLCQWHINQNAPSHFGSLNQDSRFKHLWTKCMNYCDSEEEFEMTWQEMVDKYNVGEQNWFNIMYSLRHKWATAFSNHIFSAGLMATSRSEGTNTALKKEIGNSTSTLLDCIHGYEKVLSNWRTQEKEKDIHCRHNQPALYSRHNPLLKQAATHYTHSIFHIFQIEHKDQSDYECMEDPAYASSSLKYFKVMSYSVNSRTRVVTYDCDKLDIMCSCHKFETLGILCKHILRVFTQVNQRSIPEKYIKKRWTKMAKVGASNKSSECAGGSCNSTFVSDMAFVNYITKSMHDLAMRGKAHVEARDILTDSLQGAKEKIDALFFSMNLNDRHDLGDLRNDKSDTRGIEMLVRDPPTAKSKGITNIHKRHWDDHRNKKRKGKAETLKSKTKGARRKGQTSQTIDDEQPSQDISTTNIQPEQVRANQPYHSFQEARFDSQIAQSQAQQPFPILNESQLMANQSSWFSMSPFETMNPMSHGVGGHFNFIRNINFGDLNLSQGHTNWNDRSKLSNEYHDEATGSGK